LGMTDIRESIRLSDLGYLRSAEFQRLLRLAHAEGLIPEILSGAGVPYEPPQPISGWTRWLRVWLNWRLKGLSQLERRRCAQ
jgi:hypothetical protein